MALALNSEGYSNCIIENMAALLYSTQASSWADAGFTGRDKQWGAQLLLSQVVLHESSVLHSLSPAASGPPS